LYQNNACNSIQGDVRVAYADGITEALNDEKEEFGDDRFVSCIQAHRGIAADALLECYDGPQPPARPAG
jgi:serine phosphatase RsbU (regulator of sigma subunit)